MTSIQEKIQDAASRNAELLKGLHETDSAPSQLYQQIQYIKDLDSQIQKTTAHVENLRKKTASELKDHKKYSESTFRRFAHKASGRKERFAEKAAKEEREYFDAIQEQKTGEDQLVYTKQLKAEAETLKAQYEKEANRHDTLQRELDALYDRIFTGYTPGFPDEDAKEHACTAAAYHSTQLNQQLEQEKHVSFLLKETTRNMTDALRYMDSAHSASQMDLFGGGTLASMQKRNYLEKAESSISNVRMLQQQIRLIKPNLADIGPMNVASGSIWGDVIFDNIFSDMDMHDKIKVSEAQLGRANEKLKLLIKEEDERVKKVQADLQRASEALQQARVELQKAREHVFARVTGGEQVPRAQQAPPEGAPPTYSAWM
ncbi:hypothetical protein K469DRAFT_663407 [Zopfia rhizophila CBS 207.26]|uniref:Uncharacterized protein n=1 Tax=Zopfia rhizophila CBS 207.26 TaxID=1314779 RepID=A0A6A6E7N9_9PEZI|nr:hypothetical protein K469DRAFT_663407 [Zopfia rhizophila CBS 207.26]